MQLVSVLFDVCVYVIAVVLVISVIFAVDLCVYVIAVVVVSVIFAVDGDSKKCVCVSVCVCV